MKYSAIRWTRKRRRWPVMTTERVLARQKVAGRTTRGQVRAARLIGNFEKAVRRMEAAKRGDRDV